MEIQVGKQSLAFAEAPYIISSASIVGKKEGEGPLGNRFDVVGEDDKFGQNTWEEAESTLQKEAFTLAVGKGRLENRGHPLSVFGRSARAEYCDILRTHGLPGAAVRALWSVQHLRRSTLIGRDVCGGGYADYVVAMTSSHFCPARKSSSVFRWNMPISAQNQRRGRSRGAVLTCLGKKKQGAHHGDHDR